jgi:hypothetical protein
MGSSEKHCRCWVRFTIEDVWLVYEYFFYTVREDQAKCIPYLADERVVVCGTVVKKMFLSDDK